LISRLVAEYIITQYYTCAFEPRRRGSEEDVVIQVSTQILNNHMTGSKYMIMNIEQTFGNLISKLVAEYIITQYYTCAFEPRRRGSEEDVVIQESTQILNR